MNTARKGRRFEHEIRELFRSAGFSVVRGAGSKGEFFGQKTDLVATRLTDETEYKIEIYGMQLKAKKRKG